MAVITIYENYDYWLLTTYDPWGEPPSRAEDIAQFPQALRREAGSLHSWAALDRHSGSDRWSGDGFRETADGVRDMGGTRSYDIL